MQLLFVPLIVFASLFYGGMNYYVGLRGWEGLFSFIPPLNQRVYWAVVIILALSYILSKLAERFLPYSLYRWINILGAYWFAVMFYALFIDVLIDLVRLLDRFFHFIPAGVRSGLLGPYLGVAILIILGGIVGYGSWNARHPRIKRYEIRVDKQAGRLASLHALLISDIHLGAVVHTPQLNKMVRSINALDPDIVLFAGDIIDDDLKPFMKEQMGRAFARIRSRYGVYAVPGNHEHIGGNAAGLAAEITQRGVTVLNDRVVEVAEGFYLVGRADASDRGAKKELSELMVGLDKRKPVIVLDHQPSRIAAAEKAGADLYLAGHTHAGQLFPIGFITGRLFEIDHGMLQKGTFHAIVSSGYGTWGPPIRTGNRPEIVDIRVAFGREPEHR